MTAPTNGAQDAASAPAAPLAADSPMVATPRANVQMAPQTMQAQEGVKLSPFFSGVAAPAKPKGGGGFFKKKPGKWHFGQAIRGVSLGADGVPEALALLRQTLWGSMVTVPSWWRHSSLPWPPGADSPGSWLRYALGTIRRAAQGPVGGLRCGREAKPKPADPAVFKRPGGAATAM